MYLSILGKIHHRKHVGDYHVNLFTTCSMNLCVCNCEDLHAQKNFKKNLLKEIKNQKEKHNKAIIAFKNFSKFIFFLTKFLINNKIIIIKLIIKFIYLFNFKRHGSCANCHQVMSIKRNLTPTVANFLPGRIPYVTSLWSENPR